MGIGGQRRRERLLEAARGYLLLDMPDHALEQLDAVPDPEESSFVVHELRGEALRAKQDYHAALREYSRALAEKPTDLTVLMGLAWCYKRTDQLPKSIAAMHEAYRSHSDEPVVLYNLACYYALSGNKTQALSWLGRALRMRGELRQWIAHESDFDQLRHDPDFQLVAGTREDLREV